MVTIEERFAHISQPDKDEAVAGFVQVNPHMDGIDFYTMMEMILDADAQIAVLGDVEMDEANCASLVQHFISLKRLGFGPSNERGA